MDILLTMNFFLNINNFFINTVVELIIFYRYLGRKKNNTIWVFGAIRGEKYMDNAKYFFEYLNNNSNIRAVWISKNKELIKQLNTQGYEAYYEHTLRAIEIVSQAKVAVITHRGNRKSADLPFYAMSEKTKIVQLWHGIPLKKIAYDDKIFSHVDDENSLLYQIKTGMKSRIFPYLNYVNNPSLILALSVETEALFTMAFRTNEETVVTTGYPRNDILIHSEHRQTGIKKIIYMPTFRGDINSKTDLFIPYGFDVKKFDTFLNYRNIELHIKLHPFSKVSTELLEAIKQSDKINLIKVDDIYGVLNQYDMLITDYSSIYFDYLLLDRPIVFAPFDKTKYLKNDRELYFEYDEVTPGPKASNWLEVIKYIENYLDNSSLFKKDRLAMKNRFHLYQDNKSSKRTYEAIERLLDV